MKHTYLGILLLLLVGHSRPAAAQYFNKRIDPFAQGLGSTAFGVEVRSDGGYIIVAAAAFSDSLFYSSVVTSLVIGDEGDVGLIDRVIAPLSATYPGWSNTMAKRIYEGYIAGGNDYTIDSLDNAISRAVIYFISYEGNIDSMVAVSPDNQRWIGRATNQAPDGGFLICGETSATGNGLQGFVIRTDAQGNELWTQTYGGPWNDGIISIAASSDSTLFTGGIRRVSSSDRQFWVQCLGANGDVVWEKIWGGAYPESNAAISLASNGDVLAAGSFQYVTTMARRYLARISPLDGSFIWQYQYAPQAIDCALQTVKEVLPSMDLIACGSMSAPGAQNFGTLLRTTSDGDSLWMRHYQYHAPVAPSSSGLLRDVVPTPDGGFIAVGSAFPLAGVYTQDVWVIKVDSMGCLEPGCHLITGIESQVSNLKGALTVAPNPVRAGEAVQLSISLPPSITPQGPLRLTVVSSDGRLVQEQHFAPHSSELTLHTSFAPGLYHLHISDATRWLAGAKVVVE